MPRVCARCAPIVVVLIATAFGTTRHARAADLPPHMGLYVAKSAGSRAGSQIELTEVPAVASTIEATARGPLIEVVTTQRFTNTSKRTIEAVYVFPLPPDAAVSAMAIRVGEKTIHAEVVPREQALTRHEAAVAAGVVGALFEQDRPDVFTQTLTGIAPGATVEIELRWDTIATRRDGQWELVVPLVVAPRAVPGTATGKGVVGSGTSPDTDRSPDASRVTPPSRDDGTATAFSLRFDDRVADVTSPSHELTVKKIGDGVRVQVADATSARDLILRWKTKGKPRGWLERDDDAGFVAVTVEAPAGKGKPRPVRAVIAIDDGGTRTGEAVVLGHRIERALIDGLGKTDKVAVRTKAGTYDWKHTGAADGAGASSRHDLAAELGRIGDATLTEAGVEIILVTDGLVADQPAAIAAAKELVVPVHVIGVGAAPNRSLVLAIAAATGGTARFADADDVAATARAVLADLARPAAAPAIDWNGLEVSDVYPAVLPRLGAGQAVTVLGRTGKPRAAKVKVDRSGAFALAIESRPRQAPIGATSAHGLLGRLWARARLGDLIATSAPAADVSRVAMTYGLVSPYTAMIAVGEEVVASGGTRHSMAVPVAVPSGMRWQAKFRDELDAKTDKEKNEESLEQPAKTHGKTPARDRDGRDTAQGGTKPAPEPIAPTSPTGGGEGQDGESIDTGGAAGGDATGSDDDEDGVGDSAGPRVMMDSPTMAEGSVSSSRGRGGLVFGLRAGGGVAFGGDTRRGMATVAGRLALSLGGGRLAVGPDLGLWIVGSETDLAFRALLSTTVGGLADGYVDLSLGIGGHIADDSGIGYAAGIRFGRGAFGPSLRWDGALIRGVDNKLHSAGALNLTLEVSF